MLHVTTSVVNWKSDGYLWRSISSRNVVQQWWLRIVVNPIASPGMIRWRSAECPSAFLPRIFGKISGGSLYWLVNIDFPTMGSENPLFCWIAKSSKRFWSSNRGLGHTARLLSNCRTVFVCIYMDDLHPFTYGTLRWTIHMCIQLSTAHVHVGEPTGFEHTHQG